MCIYAFGFRSNKNDSQMYVLQWYNQAMLTPFLTSSAIGKRDSSSQLHYCFRTLKPQTYDRVGGVKNNIPVNAW